NCLLLIYLPDDVVRAAKLVIIKIAIVIIQAKFNIERLLKKECNTQMNNLEDASIQNMTKNTDELNSVLHEFHMLSKDSYQTIVVPTKDTQSQLMKTRIITLLRTLKKEAIFFDQHHYSAVLYNFDQADGPITKAYLQRVVQDFL